VAPAREYVDKITNKLTQPVTTVQIYWGAVPFVVIQVIMVIVVIAFPKLVTGNIETIKFDPSKVQIILPTPDYEQRQIEQGTVAPPDFGAPKSDAEGDPGAEQPGEEPANPGEADDLEKLLKQQK
jgi:GntP family gluconate:H+ symporter